MTLSSSPTPKRKDLREPRVVQQPSQQVRANQPGGTQEKCCFHDGFIATSPHKFSIRRPRGLPNRKKLNVKTPFPRRRSALLRTVRTQLRNLKTDSLTHQRSRSFRKGSNHELECARFPPSPSREDGDLALPT